MGGGCRQAGSGGKRGRWRVEGRSQGCVVGQISLLGSCSSQIGGGGCSPDPFNLSGKSSPLPSNYSDSY